MGFPGSEVGSADHAAAIGWVAIGAQRRTRRTHVVAPDGEVGRIHDVVVVVVADQGGNGTGHEPDLACDREVHVIAGSNALERTASNERSGVSGNGPARARTSGTSHVEKVADGTEVEIAGDGQLVGRGTR